MLGAQTQIRLADFIKAVADWETGVEVTRQILAEKKSFEPQAAFDHLDIDEKGYLSSLEILSFLNTVDVYPTESEVKKVISQYNPAGDATLTYEDFANMVLPTTSAYLTQLALSRRVYKLQGLSYTSAWALARVFDKEIKEMRKIEIFRQDLLDRNDWNANEAFELIDSKEQGHLTPFNILEFLRTRKVVASYDDILSFLRKADRDEDGKISFREFLNIVQSDSKSISKSGSPSRSILKKSFTPQKSEAVSKTRSPSRGSTSYNSFTPQKMRLTDQDYGEYLDHCKKPTHQTRESINSESRGHSSENKESHKIHQSPNYRVQSIDNAGDLRSRYSSSKISDTNTKDHLADLRARYTIKKDYSTPQRDHSYLIESNYASGIKLTESQWGPSKKGEDVARKLQFGEQEEVNAKKPEEPEEFDFTGYRATLGRQAGYSEDDGNFNASGEGEENLQHQITTEKKEPRPEVSETYEPKEEKNQDSYITPKKVGKRGDREGTSARKRSPVEHIRPNRSERSPGRYSGIKAHTSKSPMKGYEEEYLVRAVRQIIEIERDLQTFKCNLAARKDFTSITSFRKIINQDGDDTTTKEQFEDNLRKFGVFFTQTESETVFNKFDNDGDGTISLKDYEHIIVPANRDFAKKLQENDVTTELSDNTLKLLTDYVKKFAEHESRLQDMRVRLSKRFSLEDAFKAIDSKDQGFIDSEELEQILTHHGVFPTEKDLKNVISKIDTDNDGKLSIQEFVRTFSPVKDAKNENHNEEQKEDEYKEHNEIGQGTKKENNEELSKEQSNQDNKDLENVEKNDETLSHHQNLNQEKSEIKNEKKEENIDENSTAN